jgi:hypothetical protein
METETTSEDTAGSGATPPGGSRTSRFYLANLRGEEFRETDMSGVRMRGVLLDGADIDGSIYGLRVNGVEIQPLVEAELDRRHPERALLRDHTVAGLRAAHAAYSTMWERTYERVAAMPPESVGVSVDDEYTFAQTLRHLVFCTDGWLRWGAEGRRGDDVFWSAGVSHTEYASQVAELGIDPAATPSYDDVLSVRRARVGELGDFLAGLTPERARMLAEENALTGALTPMLVMSHLACADQPAHPMNRQQLESFQQVRALFPQTESSLCNSAGILLGGDYLCDLTRPGIALYGGSPVGGTASPMRAVVTAEARIAQIRRVAAGQAASYGATPLVRDTVIAVCSTGYADGYHRAASGAGVPLRQAGKPGACGFIHGKEVPVLGRVTMDLTLFDVTELGPDAVAVGEHIELFGPNMPIDRVAEAAGTVAYELLTSLGRRYYREYVGGGA